MSGERYPIPSRRNALLCVTLLLGLPALLLAAGRVPLWALPGLMIVYAIFMNTGYSLIHEAEHGLLQERENLNHFFGAALALFFPAPYHLLRQGHLGHHLRNRSDDEAFDLYIPGERKFFKFIQLYGTVSGLYWVLVAACTPVAALHPRLLKPAWAKFDRTTEAIIESLNPRYDRLIRLEATAAVLLHGGLIYFGHIPVSRWLLMGFAFGFTWSAMQYAHHYATVRDVALGARNLRTFAWLDRLWLNHNWHLNHHRQPVVPWLHLPALSAPGEVRGSLLQTYLGMWRGPRPAAERVENHYAGKLIR